MRIFSQRQLLLKRGSVALFSFFAREDVAARTENSKLKTENFRYRLVTGASILAAVFLLTSCASGPKGPTTQQIEAAQRQAVADGIPQPLQHMYIDLLTDGERQYVLNAMRLGLAAERSGYSDLAKRVFDQAIKRVASLQAGAEQAERTKSKFVADEEKWFKGEAYERSALYLYRGILYAADGDWGNAAACAKRAQVEDIASKEQDAGDWYSAEWLLAFASLKQNDPGTANDALARAAKFPNRQGDVLPPHAADNVLIVAEAGHGPIKVGLGEYQEKLAFNPGDYKTTKLEIDVPAQAPATTAAADSVYVQATTRGPRKLDYILNGKAEFKSATDMAGNAAIVAGAATALTSNNDTQTIVGLGLVAAGLISKGVSASSHPAADTRTWDNLPNSIFLHSFQLPVGTHQVTLKAFDASGKIVKQETLSVVINPQQNLTVIWTQLP